MTVDGAAIAGAALLQWLFYPQSGRALEAESVLGFGAAAALIYAGVASWWGLYRLQAILEPPRRRRDALLAWCAFASILAVMIILLGLDESYPRASLIAFTLLGFVSTIVSKQATAALVALLMTQGRLAGRNAVVIGEPAELDRLNASYLFFQFGLNAVARIPLDERPTHEVLSRESQLALERAINAARERCAEEIVLAIRWSHTALVSAVNDRLARTPLPVRLLPDHGSRRVIDRAKSFDAGPAWSVELQRAPMNAAQCCAKRALDVLLALAALCAVSPVLLITAAAVKLDSPGPVIFRQRRNGFNEREFVIYKFRTMTVLEDGARVVQARKGDSRVTRAGRFLRRNSIDELPQLFNVLKGDMSLVGPRPHALAHDAKYNAAIPEYVFRSHVKPGITGLAQVNGRRGETANIRKMRERVVFDIWYIRNWSLALDLWILLRTPFELLKSKAY